MAGESTSGAAGCLTLHPRRGHGESGGQVEGREVSIVTIQKEHASWCRSRRARVWTPRQSVRVSSTPTKPFGKMRWPLFVLVPWAYAMATPGVALVVARSGRWKVEGGG